MSGGRQGAGGAGGAAGGAGHGGPRRRVGGAARRVSRVRGRVRAHGTGGAAAAAAAGHSGGGVTRRMVAGWR
jgi:hypothetical protein